VDLWNLSTWVIPAVLAITLHEAAHGYAARKFGDPTAHLAGRISMNPLRHVDPLGTILLPGLLILANAGFLFGYAKPVPVDFRRLRDPRRDMVLVAAAGPGMNLLLALTAAILYHAVVMLPDGLDEWVAGNLVNAIKFNVVLAVFNMLPIPPLDGGRVAVGLLPDALAYPLARLERVGIFIVLGTFLLLPMLLRDVLRVQFDPVHYLIMVPADAIMRLIITVTGLA
jgi:Zn-dependent protease